MRLAAILDDAVTTANRLKPEVALAAVVPAAVVGPRPRALLGVRVLVVDDDPDIRYVFQFVLERAGADALSVGSVAEALVALRDWQPDVVLSDLSMPEESGYDLMRHLAALPAPPPAGAITAHRTDEDKARALACGFRLYLGKPIDAVALVAAVVELAAARAPT